MLASLGVDRVIFGPGSLAGDEQMIVIHELRDVGVKVSVIPDASRLIGASVESDVLGGMTLLGMRRFGITRSSQVIKRSFDVAISGLLLLVLSPLLAAIAIAIRVDQPGAPILYRQRRIGREGRTFWMIKFRTMNEDSHRLRENLRELDQGAHGLFKIPDDPRATRVGRRLRRHNLDELPQLINVLRGEMSLVGPRPAGPRGGLERAEQLPAAPLRAPGHHGPLAGARLGPRAARGDGQARLPLRGELVAVGRHRPHRPDGAVDRPRTRDVAGDTERDA